MRIRESHAAREAERAVHHENAPVVVVVEHPEHPGLHRVEELHVAAGTAEDIDVCLMRLPGNMRTATLCAAPAPRARRGRAFRPRPTRRCRLEVHEVSAEEMAASIAGKIASPASRSSSLLPATAARAGQSRRQERRRAQREIVRQLVRCPAFAMVMANAYPAATETRMIAKTGSGFERRGTDAFMVSRVQRPSPDPPARKSSSQSAG